MFVTDVWCPIVNPTLSPRGLFVIDDKGILRQITVNDLPVGRSVDETLRLVQAFQFTDKNGEGEQRERAATAALFLINVLFGVVFICIVSIS